MDGEAVEDNECWCPGVVCIKKDTATATAAAAGAGAGAGAAAAAAATSPAISTVSSQAAAQAGGNASAGQGGDGGVPSPVLVVHVLGQSHAEFAVDKDNLTAFPGYGDNLETVQHSVATGLGNPPDYMCLAVGQAILACLKCGWHPEKGTNILEPALCNDQAEGDERVRSYATAWGVNPDNLEDLLKFSWQLMKPLARDESGGLAGGVEDDVWDHLRATWRKIERMWRSAADLAELGDASSAEGGDRGDDGVSGGGGGDGVSGDGVSGSVSGGGVSREVSGGDSGGGSDGA
ncbi:unnamed protein product, partial [Laminaria digitata]